MPAKSLPADALEALRQRLHTLPPRSPERHQMIHATAATYGVSDTTVYRALQARTVPPGRASGGPRQLTGAATGPAGALL